MCCAGPSRCSPKMYAAARDRERGGVGRRAAQRRGRPRRDLSGDGEQRDDVRRAGLSAGPSAAGGRAAVGREASGRACRTRPIASRASRRSGTPGSRAMRCWRPATTRRCARVTKGLQWLEPKQILDVRGDWIARRPDVRPGGWAFQYANPHYPDVDDTAVVALAMDRAQGARSARSITARRSRGRRNGSSGCRARTAAGARSTPTTNTIISTTSRSPTTARLLDPPTEDVTARCVSMLAQLGETPQNSPAVSAAVDYLKRTQLADGSWYGRWGMNYIYGTWSVLCALNAAGVDHGDAGDAQGRGMADRDPERRRRLGRGRRRATSSTIAAMSRRRAPRHRPPGRCSG